MKKFIHIEENGDGTSTFTINLDPEHEEDLTAVIPFGIEEFAETFNQGIVDEAARVTAEVAVIIPNNLGDGK